MLTIYISKQAQIAEAAAARRAHAKRDYNVPPELVQRVIDLGGEITSVGEVELDAQGLVNDWRGVFFGRAVSDQTLLPTVPADCEAAVAALEAIRAPALAAREEQKRAEAQKKAEERQQAREKEAQDNAILASLSDEQIAARYHERDKPPYHREISYLPTLRDVLRLGSASTELLNARLPGINAVLAKHVDAHIAALEQLEAEERAKVDAWIDAHGSARLKRCRDEGIEHSAILRDEYLAHEFPGWVRYVDVPWESTEARNPSEGAFVLLDRARAVAPEAELWFWQDKEHDLAGYAAEVEVTIPGVAKPVRIVLTDKDCTWSTGGDEG